MSSAKKDNEYAITPSRPRDRWMSNQRRNSPNPSTLLVACPSLCPCFTGLSGLPDFVAYRCIILLVGVVEQ